MKQYKNIIPVACLLILFTSCRKDDKLGDVQQPVGLGGDVTTGNAIDKWISDSLTAPYNMAVTYRWDPANASLYNIITPPQESRIIPLLSSIRKAWIDPYNEVTGSTLFIKKYAPKQLILLGSVEYLGNNQALAGQALEGGGNAIALYDINQNYTSDPIAAARSIMLIIHHEFGHILHQNIAYPQEFIGISSKLGLPGYTATWFNVTDAEALENGYASNYAMSGKDDDFVETIAIMLTQGRTKWEEMKAGANATARQALQQKENLIVSYYQKAWNIDFYALQTRVQASLNALYPPPAVSDIYGFGKAYTSGQYGTSTLFYDFPAFVPFPASAGFTTIFNLAKTRFAAETASLTLRSFELYFTSATNVALYIYYNPNNATANATFPSTYAIYNYRYVKDASGNYTFTYFSAGTNGAARLASATPLVDYFKNTFKLEWYESPNVSNYPKVKLTPINAPDSWFTVAIAP